MHLIELYDDDGLRELAIIIDGNLSPEQSELLKTEVNKIWEIEDWEGDQLSKLATDLLTKWGYKVLDYDYLDINF